MTRPTISFRLEHCPRCGYALAGLPRRHACPECGFEYDESMLLLHGWTVPSVRRRPFLWFSAAVLAVLAIAPIVGLGWSWWTGLVALAAALMVLTLAYPCRDLRQADDRDGHTLVRYLVRSDGIVTSRGRVLRWPVYSNVLFLQEGADSWRIHIYPAWWRAFVSPIVNIEFRGDPSEAEGLRRELQRRINEARDRRPGQRAAEAGHSAGSETLSP